MVYFYFFTCVKIILIQLSFFYTKSCLRSFVFCSKRCLSWNNVSSVKPTSLLKNLYEWLFTFSMSNSFTMPKAIFELSNDFITVNRVDYLYPVAFPCYINRNIKVVIRQEHAESISSTLFINLTLIPWFTVSIFFPFLKCSRIRCCGFWKIYFCADKATDNIIKLRLTVRTCHVF